MSLLRTFISLEPPRAACKGLEEWRQQLETRRLGARFGRFEQLHLTLAFLGDISDRSIPEVCRIAAAVGQAHRPFEIRLAGLGVFPHPRKPNVLWVGVALGAEPFVALATDLIARLAKAGYRVDGRPVTPHLTIARWDRGQRALDETELSALLDHYRDITLDEFVAEEIHVMSSTRSAGGMQHAALARCPLGATLSDRR